MPPEPPAETALPRKPMTPKACDALYCHSYLTIVERLALECAAPAAAIVQVEPERLWLRAGVGMPGREMARRSVLGDLVAGGDGIMVVEDLAADERFAARPLVLKGRRMRFYAGAPLVMHGGRRVGALCVLDSEPRPLSLAEARHLRWLTGRATILMNVQKAVEQVAFGRVG